ncbi:hypothetical protein SPBR_05363 [Sporothrix brasiliensis 5110]|uniref:Aminoglycoside phosphotransferase domain-containing protein n=1 Tax=Sporothrix brasiliensis 5110 TaxID=1398154 RepID=A0A0C2IEV0_9PEZI|nr:uncharacterized protein SPBR_05363 [Sporothrix brasiliensis 5110]KIH87756.1 hypothetical protein SPBR_05363 [Sporothrix brasiliensis 5110]
MDNPPGLPYFAPADKLPEPLPSHEAIVAAEVCYADTVCSRVVRVGTHYVVKYGPDVSLIEGQTLRFVEPLRPPPFRFQSYGFLYNNGPPEKAAFYRHTLSLVFHGHRPVFSHNDLQTMNLILRPDGTLTIID